MTGDLVGAVLRGVLGHRRKRSRNALHYLGRRSGGLITANTVMTVAGLAWGVYESWRASQTAATPAAPSTPAVSGPPGAPPPLPGVAAGTVDATSGRLIRLAMAAANADGTFTDQERAAITAQAKAAGATDAELAAWSGPVSLHQIVSGVDDPREKATLYLVAFTIVRADEQVAGSERIFLAQLAALLGLDAAAVAHLEQTVGSGIDGAES